MPPSNSTPCAACKHMKRRCKPECLFAPHFPLESSQRFEQVHKVFGSNNVMKFLRDIHPSQREDAVKSLVYQSEARLRDPVHGCIGFISELQGRVNQIKTDINKTMEEISTYLGPEAMKSLEAMVQNPSLVPPIEMVIPNQYLAGNSHDQLVIQHDQQQPSLGAPQLDTIGKFASGIGSSSGGESSGVKDMNLGTFNIVSPNQIQQQEGETQTLDPLSPQNPKEAQT